MSGLITGGPIRVGDPTSKGGVVIGPGVPFMSIEGKPAVTRGMYAQCCGGLQVFVQGCYGMEVYGHGLVLQGHKLSCGCHAISTCSLQDWVQDTMPASFLAVADTQAMQNDPAQSPSASQTDLAPRAQSSEQAPTLNTVTVHLGLFFDGTNNNAPNTELGAQCREPLRDEADVEAMQDFCRSYMQTGSYLGAPSNVAKLHALFRDSAQSYSGEPESEYFIPLYIEGIGTTTGEPDSLIQGQAMGRGVTGVRNRAEQVLNQTVREVLDRFAEDQPDRLIQTVVLHVFGFSRGAAAARHFVALVHQRGIDLCDPLANCKAYYVPGFHPKRDVRVAFVGLFDTVVNVGLDAGSGDPVDARRHELEIELPAGCAGRIVQLCAGDEHRMNYPLTLISPPHTDIALPGAHSDT